jgi:tetratricopeptide (TPR) repeat protein
MSVQDLYQKACDAVERANYDYAVELFREVLRQEPQYPDARMALRGTERRRLQGKGGAGGLTAPLAGLLTSLKVLFAKPRKQLEIYEDYLQKYPNSYWALMGAAGAARKCALQTDALMMYTDALKIKPSDKKGLRTISDAYMEAGQKDEALKYLMRLADMEPMNRDLQREVRDVEADTHMAAHQMDEAGSFRDLIRDKDEASRLEKSRRMAVTMDDLREQAADLEKLLQDNPKHVLTVLKLAQVYLDTGQLQAAGKLLKETAQLLPDNYELRAKLGDVQLRSYDAAIAAAADQNKKAELRQRRLAFALKDYAWRVSQHPTDRELQMKLAGAYYEAGNYNEAIATYQGTLQDGRFAVESAKMLGLCFIKKNQFDLALEQFRGAIQRHQEMDGEGKELHYCLADAYEQMGNKPEALKVYKKIYSQDINFRDVARKVDVLST